MDLGTDRRPLDRLTLRCSQKPSIEIDFVYFANVQIANLSIIEFMQAADETRVRLVRLADYRDVEAKWSLTLLPTLV